MENPSQDNQNQNSEIQKENGLNQNQTSSIEANGTTSIENQYPSLYESNEELAKKQAEDEETQKIKNEEKIKEAIQEKSSKLHRFMNDLDTMLQNINVLWTNGNQNYQVIFEENFQKKILELLNYPCITTYTEYVLNIFKFLCQYFLLRMNFLDKIHINELNFLCTISLCNFNIFWRYPKFQNQNSNNQNNNNQVEIQNYELIGDSHFYYIFKELLPDKEVENFYINIISNCMSKYFFEFLFQSGYYENFINKALSREDIDITTFCNLSYFAMAVLNQCEKDFLLKHDYNIKIIKIFIEKMDFYLTNPDIKKVDTSQWNFVCLFVNSYIERIFGMFNRVLDELKERYLEDCQKFCITIPKLLIFFLKQQSLTLRVFAMNWFNSIIEFYRQPNYDFCRKRFNDIEKIHTFGKECLVKYLCEENIFDLIFGENIHEAIIQRSYQILSLLYKNKSFPPSQIAILWKISENKYQTISESIITLMGKLLPEFISEDCDNILGIVSKINFKEVNEVTLKLLENFFVGNERRENLLNILYRLSNELSFNEGLNDAIITKSRNILVKLLLTNKNYYQDLINCVKKCINGIRDNYLVNTNIFILKQIMDELRNKQDNQETKEIFKQFNENICSYGMFVSYLNKDYFLFPVLLNSILEWKRFLLFLSKESIKVRDLIYEMGNFDHDSNLNVDKFFIEYKNYIKDNVSYLSICNKNQMDIDTNYENEIQYNNDFYIKSILKDFILFFKTNFLKSAIVPSEDDIVYDIFHKFEISIEKKSYMILIRNILDFIIELHLHGKLNFQREYFDFMYQLLVINKIDKEEKVYFYNVLGNFIRDKYISAESNILTEENIQNLILEKICSKDISSLPHSAYLSVKLFMINFNEKNGNASYSKYLSKFTDIKKFELLVGFKTLWEFYLKTSYPEILNDSKEILINILEICSQDMINRKIILNQIFEKLSVYKKNLSTAENKIGFIRLLKLISVVNGTRVSKNLFDQNNSKNFVNLLIKNNYFSNSSPQDNLKSNLPSINCFKGAKIKELKERIISEIICTEENLKIFIHNSYMESPFGGEQPVKTFTDFRNEVYQKDIIILSKGKMLKDCFTIADYHLEGGDTLIVVAGNGYKEEEFKISEEQLKEGYNQIRVVFPDNFSEETMKKAIIKHRGDIENSILFLTDKTNVENLLKEIESDKNSLPQKIEEIVCLEEDKINLLLEVLKDFNTNENNNKSNEKDKNVITKSIWDLFSEIKYPDNIVNKSISEDFNIILADDNLNRMILNLKLVNSLIFDNDFCHYNKINQEQKNIWINKFIVDKNTIIKILQTLSTIDNNKYVKEDLIIQIIDIFINWYYEIINKLSEMIRIESFKRIKSEIDLSKKKNNIEGNNNTGNSSSNLSQNNNQIENEQSMQNGGNNKNENNNNGKKDVDKFQITDPALGYEFLKILNENNATEYFYNILRITKSLKTERKKFIIQNIYEILLIYFFLSPEKIKIFISLEEKDFIMFNLLNIVEDKDIAKQTLDFFKILINIIKFRENDISENNKADLQISLLKAYKKKLTNDELLEEKFYEFYGFLLRLKKIEYKNGNNENISTNNFSIEMLIDKFFNDIYELSENLSNYEPLKPKIIFESLLICNCHSFYDDLIIKKVENMRRNGKNIISLLYDCLFEIKKNKEDNIINIFKFDKENLRKSTLELLNILLSLDKKYLDEILPKILHNHNKIFPKKENIYIDFTVRDVNSDKIIGLRNFGCTCYLNSLLQQMFMIPTFRQDLFSFQISTNDQVSLASSVIYNMQITFANLKKCCMTNYPPYKFIKSFPNNVFNGEPIRFNIQQDSDEFLAILCDNLEKEAKPYGREHFLENSFKGKIANEIVSLEKEFPYYSQSEEPFYRVTLDIKGHQTLEEALDAFIKGEALDGDNKYYVEKYKKKISIRKCMSLKKLGNEVIIHLKRFEFDFFTFTNNKLNDYLKFPLEINFKKWTRVYLRSNEQNIDIPVEEQENLNDEKMTYILTGILIHSGSNLQSGHYYSYIMDQETGEWYEFNDSRISNYNINTDLEKECFGNKEGGINQYGRGAYLLFYTKKEKFRNKDLLNPIQISDKIFDDIYEENVQCLKLNNYVSDVYQNFLEKFVKNSLKLLNDSSSVEHTTNLELRKEEETFYKILSVLKGNKENDMESDDEDIEVIPDNIDQIYDKCKSEVEFNMKDNLNKNILINNKYNKENLIDNNDKEEDESEKEKEIDDLRKGGEKYTKKNIIKLFYYYVFGIGFQYMDYNQNKLSGLLQFFNEVVKENPGYSLWILKSIEKNVGFFADIIFKYGTLTADSSSLIKEFMELFKTIFDTIYYFEKECGTLLEQVTYFFKETQKEQPTVKLIKKKEYKSCLMRVIKKLFCENLEKCRIEYAREKMFLDLLFSATKTYDKISFILVDYLNLLISLISNNNIENFKSVSNPNFKMGGSSNNYVVNSNYIMIFSEVVLHSVTPGMIQSNRFSPYFLGKNKDSNGEDNDDEVSLDCFREYPKLPLGWEKMICQEFFANYVLLHDLCKSKEIVCHLSFCDEETSIKILKIVNLVFKQKYIPISYLFKIFERACNVFELRDSLEFIRLETLFQLKQEKTNNNECLSKENEDNFNLINTDSNNNNSININNEENVTLFDYLLVFKEENAILFFDKILAISEVVTKYEIVYNYFLNNKEKLKWIKYFFIEKKNDYTFIENLKKTNELALPHYPDIMSKIQKQFIEKLEL